MRREALTLVPGLRNTFAVHNGANEALFYPTSPGVAPNRSVPLVLYVGRLVPIKGVHVLLKAMRILHDRNVQVACKIVGSSHAGGTKSRLTSYVKMLHANCPANVHFEGFTNATDIAEQYRNADIFCCPSVWQEPFGLVNIEAMASGVPVVASRVGGIPEIAADGGIVLVEPDSPVELAEALERLIQDKTLRASIGAQGLTSFRAHFTSTAIVSQYYRIAQTLRKVEVAPAASLEQTACGTSMS